MAHNTLNLTCLGQDIVASLWPRERVLVGMRVSRRIREAVSRAPDVLFSIRRKPPAGRFLDSGSPGPPSSSTSTCTLAEHMANTVCGSIHLEGESFGAEYMIRQIKEPCLGNRLASLSLTGCCMGCFHRDVSDLAGGLRQCSSLTRLELVWSSIENQDVEIIAKALRDTHIELEHLSLAGNNFWSADSLIGICTSRLKTLNVSRLPCQVIKGAPYSADAGDAVRAHFASSIGRGILPKCPMLTHLDISCRYLGLEGSLSIAHGLSCLPLLSTLYLVGVAWDAPEVAPILDNIPLLTQLMALRLSGKPPAEDAAFGRIITCCTRLSSLELAGVVPSWGGGIPSALSEERVARRAKGRKLERLHVTASGLQGSAVSSLMSSLQGWESLTELNISENCLGGEAAVVAASLLPARVTSFGLNGNEVCEFGGKLGEALCEKRALRDLHVRNNALADAGLLALIRGLGMQGVLELKRLSASNNETKKKGRTRAWEEVKALWPSCHVLL